MTAQRVREMGAMPYGRQANNRYGASNAGSGDMEDAQDSARNGRHDASMRMQTSYVRLIS